MSEEGVLMLPKKSSATSLVLEKVKCNLCGSDQSTPFIERRDLLVFLPGEFTMVKCDNCGLVYENPRPVAESWSAIYPDEYEPYTDLAETSSLRRIANAYGHRKKIKWIEKFQNGGKICDVGCANGDFLFEVQKDNKWNAFGVEPSESAAKLAKARNLRIETGFLGEDTFEGEKFDVVTMWNVIEHLGDPLATLRQINRKLNPRGWLVFTTPIVGTIGSWFFGRHWMGYELPRHFYVFSEQVLEQYMQKCGFEIKKKASIYGTFSLTMTSIKFWLRHLTGHPNSKIEKILYSPVLRVLTAPYFFIQDKLGLSSSMTVFAQKQSCGQDARLF